MRFKFKAAATVVAISLGLAGCSSGPDELVFKNIPEDAYDKGHFVAMLMDKKTSDAMDDYIEKHSNSGNITADRNLDEFKKELASFPALTDDDKDRYIAYFESRPQLWEASFNKSVNVKQQEIEAIKQKIVNHGKKVVELTAKKAELYEKKQGFQSSYYVYKNLNKQAQKLLADNNVRPADRLSNTRADVKYKETNQDEITCAFRLKEYGTDGYNPYLEYGGVPVWLNDKCYRMWDGHVLEIVLTSFYNNNPDGFESEGVKEKVLAELMPSYKDYILKDINEVQPTKKEYNEVVKFLNGAGGEKRGYIRKIDELQTEIKRINKALSIKDENVRNRDSYYRQAYYSFMDDDNKFLTTRILLRNRVNILKHLIDEFDGDIDIVTEPLNETIDISGTDVAKVYMVPNGFSGIEPFSYITGWYADYSSERYKELDQYEIYFGELPYQSKLKYSDNVDADIALLKKRHFIRENSLESNFVWEAFFGDEDDANLFRLFSGAVLTTHLDLNYDFKKKGC